MCASACVIPAPEYSGDGTYYKPLSEGVLIVSTAIFPFPLARGQSRLTFALINDEKWIENLFGKTSHGYFHIK
jgi:hypothetical protein